MERLRRELRGEAGVVITVRRLEKKQAARLENASDFAITGFRQLEVLRDIIVENDVEGGIGKGQRFRPGLMTLVQEGIGQHTGVRIDPHIASHAVSQVEMVLFILAGAGTDFQNMVGRSSMMDKHFEKLVGAVAGIITNEKIADSLGSALVGQSAFGN